MYKLFLPILVSLFCFNAKAHLSLKTDDGRIITHENLRVELIAGKIVMSDQLNYNNALSYIITSKAAIASGFKSAAQMIELINKTKNFKEGLFGMNCSLQEAQVVSSCYFEQHFHSIEAEIYSGTK